ncbi:MAG: beta-N-acetylhexosaminidase, partial [Vulcanimicrobiaceae bacterium]
MPSATTLASQVVCAGFEGTGPDEAPLARLKSLRLGAVLLFARNASTPERFRALTSALQGALADEVPALIAIDQEGGAVARLQDGVTQLPSMMSLGATQKPELARRAGRRLGMDLRVLGVNVDFAPVLDLALDPRNTVIGDRAFGVDPEAVAAMGTAFADGLRAGGAIAVAKHFPGHGATHVDSHHALPTLDVDEATWRARDLVPFARAVASGIPAIMSAHVVLSSIDARQPASRSRAILHGVLREQLGFDGVIFSDCLEMAGAGLGVAQSAPMSIAAGVDCVLISHRLDLAEEAVEAIARAVATGSLPEARLAEAAARVRHLRGTIPPAANDDGTDGDIALQIAREAIHVTRGSLAMPSGSAVTVISFEGAERPSLAAALRQRGMKSEMMRVALEPRAEDLDVLEIVLRGLAGRRAIIVTRRAHLHSAQAAAVLR